MSGLSGGDFVGKIPSNADPTKKNPSAPAAAPSQTQSACQRGAVSTWLINNVSAEGGVDAGFGAGVSGSVDMSLKEVGGDAGLGVMQFGAEAHAGVSVQLAGPGIGSGFFGETQLCGSLGLGACLTLQHQGGHTSFSVTLGVGLGASVGNALKYHQTVLPPSMPAIPGCPQPSGT
jgi:hypothetical protein